MHRTQMNEKFPIFLTHPINGEQAASKENKQTKNETNKQTNRGEEYLTALKPQTSSTKLKVFQEVTWAYALHDSFLLVC